jgi:hypothetical protein
MKDVCALTDVAISKDRNVRKEETKKILKYKGLKTEMQCIAWKRGLFEECKCKYLHKKDDDDDDDLPSQITEY